MRLNPEWKGRTMGLCGDYNDNAEDDFKTPSGGISEASVNLFGDSWKKNAFCPEPKDVLGDASCEQHPERKLWSLRRCNVLKSPLFSPCHSEVAVEPYLQNCIFDTCNCDAGGDCECLCTALAAYAQECNARGIPVKWRTQQLCPLQCDERCSIYSPCVSTCPRETCDNLMTVKDGLHLCAEDICVEGCQFESCPESQVYRNANYTECIPKSTCAKPVCAEIDGTTYYEGDRVSGDDCQSCFCSRGRVICKGEPCIITTITTAATTVAATVTIPLAEPQKCVDGWSTWINRDSAVKGKKFLDVEPLPSWMDLSNTNGFAVCDKEHMIDIRCRSVNGHQNPKELGLDVECSLERGLYCQSHANLPCVDFEISVLCRCYDTSTGVENMATEVSTQEKCDVTRPNSPHPTDCQLFYHCVSTSTGYELVEKSCGPGTLYNSETQVCDWPAEVLRTRPECSVAPGRTTQAGGKTDWSSNTGTRYENTLTTSVKKTVSTTHVCKDGETWSECAIQCTRACQYYRHILTTQDLCGEGVDCVAGCVSIDRPTCASHKFWRDGVTCVEANRCPCTSHDGISVAPGAVKKESDCEICQCVNNYYTCDTTFCGNTSSSKESETTTQPSLTTQSSWRTTSYTEEDTILLNSTVTPPAECDEANYVPLMQNLQKEIIARDSENSTLRPENLPVYTENSLPTLAKFWEPETTDANQWLDIIFNKPEPIYGVILQGGVTEDKFVTSYKVLFSEDSQTFSYVLDHAKEPRIFRGPVDKIHSVKQTFDQPIEARIIRINPLTWHNGIVFRLEILGCQDHVTLTTIKPVRPACEDSMGLDNGLMAIEQVSVSSSPQLLYNLSLSSEGVWRAALDNPHQYVQFDFLEARNLTGVATKGGDGAWTTAYKIFYSNDERHWNPIVNEDGNEREFLGNFDTESRQTNFFDKPLHARFLRVQPVKWHIHVALKIEILGCYLAYPAVKTTIKSTTIANERECNVCDGIEITWSDENCRCKDPHWWDGESCVSKSECPCLIGHVSYAVGSAYETEDCQECVCALGGTATCSPKKCEPCRDRPGLRSVVSELCTCLCKPCPAATRLCPTSDVCVNETAWCDGVQDCPDDEKNCPEIVSKIPTPATESSKTSAHEVTVTTQVPPSSRCEEPVCPLGYRIVFKQSARLRDKARRDVKTNVKSKSRKGFSATKGNSKHSIYDRPMKDQDYQQSTKNIECLEFICVPVVFPPVLPDQKKPERCPDASCPPQYEVVYEKISMYKMHRCPKYVCRPLTPQEAVCSVKGRTFNTFDNMEYKYDVCNHILARDMYGNEWYVTLEKQCVESLGQRQHCTQILVVTLNERTIILYPDLHVDIDEYTFTAKQIARFGNRIPDFRLSLMGDKIVFVSHHYGFWVIWDLSTNVKIGVVAKLAGRVDGLCGYFDGNMANDRQTPEGMQARSTVQFGNSWAMEDTPECDQHVCPRDVQKQAWTICTSVKSSTLLDACSAVIDLDRFSKFY